MVNIIEDFSQDFYVVGDIHGCFNDVLCMLKRYSISNASFLIAGDSGFGFTSREGDKQALSKLRKYVDKNNITVYFLRGNHDDPQYFKEGFSSGKHLLCIPDYTVIVSKYGNEERFRMLCIGGATSIDRCLRIKRYQKALVDYMRFHNGDEQKALLNVHKQYWENEAPLYDEKLLDDINSTMKIDYVVTHTCPSMCQPLSKDGIAEYLEYDKELVKDIDTERETMDAILKRLWDANQPLKKWIYGHYHYHNFDNINGVDYIMLDMSRNGVCDMYQI